MPMTEGESNARANIIYAAVGAALDRLTGAGMVATEEERRIISTRLSPLLIELGASEPPEALDLLAFAATLEAFLAVRYGSPDPVTYGLELCAVGGSAAALALRAGGYPEPTPEQWRQLAACLRKRVSAMVENRPATLQAAREEISDLARRVVLVIFGDAPASRGAN
jgi:hypothetical protein